MAYDEQTWADGEGGDTPINATRLNHIEDGIDTAQDRADAAYALAESAGGSVAAGDITDATEVGVNLITAVDATAARTTIGAGTSNLALGTTSSTAKAGDYAPNAAAISDATTVGRNVLKAADAAAARTAIGAGTSNLALGTTGSTAKAGDYEPDLSGLVVGDGITDIVALTQSEYDGLGTPDATTLYVIVG